MVSWRSPKPLFQVRILASLPKNMSEDNNKDLPAFNPNVASQIDEEMGLDPDDPNANRIAATEMEGANETYEGGGIHAKQTACHILKYDEALPFSKGAEEGKEKTEKELNQFLKKQNIVNVDEWIKSREALQKKK
jgi:hypothetical protein